MANNKGFVGTTILLLILVSVFLERSHGTNSTHVRITCGQEVRIETADSEHVIVNLTFDQPQPNGATCSWLVPAKNATMSNQIILTGIANLDALSCDKNVFSVSEKDPDSGTLNPLPLECMDRSVNANLSLYQPVLGQPGFSVVVSLTTTSPLLENFVFMHILPFMWTDDVCPRTQRKVILAQPGNRDSSETFSPASFSSLLSRYPNNMLCKWEFRSPDEGIVNLQIRTFVFDSDSSQACGGGDHFLVADDGDKPGGAQILPLCRHPGVRFDRNSVTGSVLVSLQTDSSGGAYQAFYFRYWSVPSCPSETLRFRAGVGEKYRFKGSSVRPQGGEQERQCQWQIVTRHRSVITLYGLEAEEFEENCDDNKDYLVIDEEKVSICNGSAFPIWSEDETMNITFHTNAEPVRRSFVLRFTAVYKSPCQGHPVPMTVVGSEYHADYVRLMPIQGGDLGNGAVCQWMFTAKNQENVVQVEVDWAEAGSDTEDRGIPFDKETCSFSAFSAYSGDTANASLKITPTCSADKSTIIYKSASRGMLFVYRREPAVAESGFRMKVTQVEGTSSDGCSIRRGASLFGQGAVFIGLLVMWLI